MCSLDPDCLAGEALIGSRSSRSGGDRTTWGNACMKLVNGVTRKGLAAGVHLRGRESCLSQRRRGESVAADPGLLAPAATGRCWSTPRKKREENRAYSYG